MKAHEVIRRPLVTEKGMQKINDLNQYLFEVSNRATKNDVRLAVQKLFDVTVTQVRTMRMTGKWKRFGSSYGQRPDWKKAVVTLKTGDKIEMIEAE